MELWRIAVCLSSSRKTPRADRWLDRRRTLSADCAIATSSVMCRLPAGCCMVYARRGHWTSRLGKASLALLLKNDVSFSWACQNRSEGPDRSEVNCLLAPNPRRCRQDPCSYSNGVCFVPNRSCPRAHNLVVRKSEIYPGIDPPPENPYWS